MSDLLTSMKRASQRFAGAVADTGAKTMLKTDMVFLERDIKTRKEAFGVEIYDILKTSDSGAAGVASEIQTAFERCQNDIGHLETKVSSKKEEMRAIDRSSAGGDGGTGGGPGAGAFDAAGGMDEAEAPGIPSTP